MQPISLPSYLCHDRGGYLDEVHSPKIRGRSEASHVANHSAAQGNEGAAAVHADLQRAVKDEVQRGL